MLKRICAWGLSVTLLASAVFTCFISVKASIPYRLEADGASFIINDTGLKNTEVVGGNYTDGISFKVKSVGSVQLVTEEAFPMAKSSFDVQLGYDGNSYGFFGISKQAEILSDPRINDKNNVNFVCERGSNGTELYISVFNGTSLVRIASVSKIGSDAYWRPSVINIAFAKRGGHWYLSVNGQICNNIESALEYAQLEQKLGLPFFENAEQAYFRFGINVVGGSENIMYYKPLSKNTNDWQTTAVNTYAFNYANIVREYRGQGITSQTLFSKIPNEAEGTREDGHIVEFTGTDGYAQTADGFDLKTTTFEVAPISADGYTDNVWYYLGFTSNPSILKDHSTKPGEAVEFKLASIYRDNYTGGWVITNSEGSRATPTSISLGRIGQWRTHRYESTYKNAPMLISFVNEVGADGEKHWYMKTTVSGSSIVVKSSIISTDTYLRFDDIIDRKVYFRMGTVDKTTADLKLYCKVSNWSESGGSTTLTPEEQAIVISIEERLNAIGSITKDNYSDSDNKLKQIRADYESLSIDARDFVSVSVLLAKENEVAALKALYECGDWYVLDGITDYSGDQLINYTFNDALNSGHTVQATTSADYDMTKYSFYWKGISVPAGSWFAFGLTTDMQSALLPKKAQDDVMTFILTPSGDQLVAQIWDGSRNTVTTLNSDPDSNARYPGFGYYNKQKEHLFSIVKKDGHWYLKVDDFVFDGRYYDWFDAYMEKNAAKTKVRFAGYGGLGACTVNLVDPNDDPSVIPDDIADQVKAFDEKVAALGGVESITKDNYTEMRRAVDELIKEKKNLPSKVQKYLSNAWRIQMLDKRLILINTAKHLGDWYVTDDDFTYVTDAPDKYSFNSVFGAGSRYATTVNPYNATTTGLEWIGVKTKGDSWFEFGLTADYTVAPLSGNNKENITFILTPRNSDIVVQYWDSDAKKAVMLAELANAVYSGFNLYNYDLPHTYGMTKAGDGHWYLYIDNKIFNGKYYDSIDTFMETYGKSAYFSFGSYTGTNPCTIILVESTYSDGSVTIDSTNVKGVLTAAQKYLQLLEENYVPVWEYDSKITKRMSDVWNKLDYRSKLEVESVLMDDEYMWEIHDLVVTYDPALYIIDNNGKNQKFPTTGDRSIPIALMVFLSAIGFLGCSATARIITKRKKIN